MFKKASWLVAAAAMAIGVPANAAQFLFSFTTVTPLVGSSVTGSGIFTTSDTAMTVGGQTAYAITGITGSVTVGSGSPSAIVAPTGNYGNYFTTGPSFLDGTGVTFNTAAGNKVTFFNQSSNGMYRVNTFSPGSSSYVSVTTSAVPEPISWALFIAGFGIVGAALRKRRSQVLALTA